mgnify:CR=1 FL=1
MFNYLLFAAQNFDPTTIITTVLMIGLVVVVFFFMFRSQKKQEKEANEMRNNLQIGDEIITIGGFHAKVVSVKEDSIVIESVLDHSKQKLARWAIQSNLTVHDDAPAKK